MPRPATDSVALRQAAEAQLEKTPAASLPPTQPDPQRLRHELDVHQIELEMQNEALRAAHAEVAAALERYTDHFDFAPVGYFNLTADGTIRVANLTGAKQVGIERARLLGRRFGLLVAESHRCAVADFLARVFATGEKQSCEIVLEPAGQPPLTGHLDARLSPDGQDCRAVLVDITERKRMEEQLRQSQKMDAIGQLAGGVAHDLNNILAAIILETDLADKVEQLPEEVLAGLKQIHADAERAANLTRQLLLFSRRQVLQMQVLDLNDTVTSLVKMLQRIIGEDVRLELQLHPTALLTLADAGMLGQVLMNLSVNARDAMPEGGRLRIETSEQVVNAKLAKEYPDAVPGCYVCLSVSDTGGGIPPEILPQIFEPFFTTKEVGKGTGLGLATVFGIVKQHHGWIKVENQVGQGVTFRVFLPAHAPLGPEPTQTIAPPKSCRGDETILLVEDEAVVRTPLCMMLQRHGYQVLAAANGDEALKLWQEHRQTIALLLTDLIMPGDLCGQELARQLQAEQPKLKVVFTSGYSAEISGRELHLGAGENFIQKPFTSIQLLETIRQCLDG